MNSEQIIILATAHGLHNLGDYRGIGNRLAHNLGRESGTNPSLHITRRTTRREIEEYSAHPTSPDTQCGVRI